MILFYLFWCNWLQPKTETKWYWQKEGDTAVLPTHISKVRIAYSKNCKQIAIREAKILGLPDQNSGTASW